VHHKRIKQKYGEKMSNETRTQSLITKFIPRMDYVYEPTSKWRGLYIISVKNSINTWLYLKNWEWPSDMLFECKIYYTNGFVAKNHKEMIIKSLNYGITHPRPPGLFAS
jgi:hypothetical protein